MAALRCAARRLGGSLLQQTQAAVAEEGRRLVPSCRFIRSRQFTGEPRKIPKGEHDEQRVQHFHQRKVVPQPDDIPLTWDRIATRVKSVLDGLGSVAYYVGITALGVGLTSNKEENDQ